MDSGSRNGAEQRSRGKPEKLSPEQVRVLARRALDNDRARDEYVVWFVNSADAFLQSMLRSRGCRDFISQAETVFSDFLQDRTDRHLLAEELAASENPPAALAVILRNYCMDRWRERRTRGLETNARTVPLMEGAEDPTEDACGTTIRSESDHETLEQETGLRWAIRNALDSLKDAERALVKLFQSWDSPEFTGAEIEPWWLRRSVEESRVRSDIHSRHLRTEEEVCCARALLEKAVARHGRALEELQTATNRAEALGILPEDNLPALTQARRRSLAESQRAFDEASPEELAAYLHWLKERAEATSRAVSSRMDQMQASSRGVSPDYEEMALIMGQMAEETPPKQRRTILATLRQQLRRLLLKLSERLNAGEQRSSAAVPDSGGCP